MTPFTALPLDVLEHIAYCATVPHPTDVAACDDERSGTSRWPPWFEDTTIVRSAAACAMASSSLIPLATALYRAVLIRNGSPDRSDGHGVDDVFDASRGALRAALRSWGVRCGGRTRTAELRARFWVEVRPIRFPLHPDQVPDDEWRCADDAYGTDIRETDVWSAQRRCLDAYGTFDAWFEAVQAPRRSAVMRRRALVDALAARGCELRDDSRICAAFVWFGEGDAEDVADAMAEMAFFVEKTDYREIFRQLKREYIHYHRVDDEEDQWVAVPSPRIAHAAKRRALRRWLLSRGDGDAERLAMDATVPTRIRHRIVAQHL